MRNAIDISLDRTTFSSFESISGGGGNINTSYDDRRTAANITVVSDSRSLSTLDCNLYALQRSRRSLLNVMLIPVSLKLLLRLRLRYGRRSIVMTVSVCLSVREHISVTIHVRSSPIFRMLSPSATRTSSVDVAIMTRTSGFKFSSYLHRMDHML